MAEAELLGKHFSHVVYTTVEQIQRKKANIVVAVRSVLLVILVERIDKLQN